MLQLKTTGAGSRRDSQASCRALVSAATHGNKCAVDNLLTTSADASSTDAGAAPGAAPPAAPTARPGSIPARELVEAAATGEVRVVAGLLARGADPNAPDARGLVPLHAARERKRLDVVQQLLRAGAYVDRVDPNGSTCLHLAVTTGSAMEARLLIDAQADVNALDASGRSALHLAAECQQAPLVDLLLENGADASALGELETTQAIHKRLREAEAQAYHAPAEVASRRRRSVDQARRASSAATPAGVRAPAVAVAPVGTNKPAVASTPAVTGRAAVPWMPALPIATTTAGEAAVARAPAGPLVAPPPARSDTPSEQRRARRERPLAPAEPEPLSAFAPRAASDTDTRGSSRRRRRPSRQAAERNAVERAPLDDDSSEPACFDLVLVYPRVSSAALASAPAEPRAPRRAELVRRLRGCGLRVKKAHARDTDGSAKTLIVVGATRTRMLAAAEAVGMRLRLRAEYGGGFSKFTRALAPHFEPAGGASGARADEAADRFELSSAQRAALIDQLMKMRAADGGAGIDLSDCFKCTDLQRRFLLHDESERLALELRVGEGSMIGAVPLPLRQIEGYLGAEYGFYFAFLHLLTRSLWLPAGLGVVLFAVEEGFGEGGLARVLWLMPAYAALLILWSTGFVETWKRRQSELAAEWDLSAQRTNSQPRPEFQGDLQRGLYSEAGEFVRVRDDELPADAEAPLLEMVPPSLPRTRMLYASMVVQCFLGATVVGTLGLVVFRFVATRTMGSRGTFGAAIAMALFVEAMSFVYDHVAHRLTEWENHRTYEAHRDSLIVKLFVFSFFNKTFGPLYIAFFKGRRTELFGSTYEERCTNIYGQPADDCMDELRTQVLTLIVVHATVSQLLEVLKPYVAFRKAQAKEAARAKAGQARESRAVRQLKLPAAAPLLTEYNELLLDFAISTLFATALPLAPLLVLVNNFFEIKADLTKVLRLNERAAPQTAITGIGLWLPLFDAVGHAAIFTNLAIIFYTSKRLDRVVKLSDANKLLLLVGIEHALLLVKVGFSCFVADVPARVLNAVALRDFLAGAWVRGERRKTQIDPVELALSARDVGAPDSEPGSDDELDDDERAHRAAEDRAAELDARATEARAIAARRSRDRAASATTAAAPAPAPATRHGDEAGRLLTSACRARSSGVAWTPFRELLRRNTARQCTDVLFALLGLLAIGGFVTLSTISFTAGDVHRLGSGMDYRFDLCARDNARAPALDSRVIAKSAEARRFAPFVPAGRNLTGLPFLFYADPIHSLGVCVKECPAPASPLAGFAAASLVCTDECARGSAEERLGRFGRCCFPAYATVEVNGYCRPASDAREATLRAAFERAAIAVDDSADARAGARSFWPTDVALDRVRGRLDSSARGFITIAADMRRFATLTSACVSGALVVSALLCAAFLAFPFGATVGSCVISVASLGALSAVLWMSGEAHMRAHAADPASTPYQNGAALAVCGYTLCALACGCALAAWRVATTARGRLGALVAEVACVLRDARALKLVPLVGVGCSGALLIWWFFVATYLVSAGLLDISAQGYPLPRFDSALVRSFAALALVGVFLAFCVQHACRMAVSGVAALWYFHRDGGVSVDAAGGTARPRPVGADRPAGMSAEALARMPRPFDARVERPVLPTLDLRSSLWLIARYHSGSVALGALVLPLLWPLKLLLWSGRACGLGARTETGALDDEPRGGRATLARACARAACLDWARVLSVDAYACVFALDRSLVPAARITWAALLAQPPSVTVAQHTTDLCFYALKFATATIVAASVGVVLVLDVGIGAEGASSASVLLPMAWSFILSYLTVSQFVLVFEATLSGLVVAFSLDASNNPREYRHASRALLGVLGAADGDFADARRLPADEDAGSKTRARNASSPREGHAVDGAVMNRRR